ncbi:MAG: hypothetical protein M3680_11865 [Myxococcota bacterium]|nr:hypothetical protein [Myxococcota bacterium]
MKKLLVVCLAVFNVALIAWSPSPSSAGNPCKRDNFDTKLVAAACAKGGTNEAKEVMKKWVKEVKSKQAGLECATCHAKMAPSYDLKPDALTTFKKLGGQ